MNIQCGNLHVRCRQLVSSELAMRVNAILKPINMLIPDYINFKLKRCYFYTMNLLTSVEHHVVISSFRLLIPTENVHYLEFRLTKKKRKEEKRM